MPGGTGGGRRAEALAAAFAEVAVDSHAAHSAVVPAVHVADAATVVRGAVLALRLLRPRPHAYASKNRRAHCGYTHTFQHHCTPSIRITTVSTTNTTAAVTTIFTSSTFPSASASDALSVTLPSYGVGAEGNQAQSQARVSERNLKSVAA